MIQALMAGVNLLGGLSSSRKAAKLQKRQIALQEQTLADQRAYRDGVQARYGDIEKMVLDSARQGVQADLAGVTARAGNDVAAQYKNVEDQRLRTAGRMGLNPNSGRADSMARQNAIAQASTTAGLVTQQRNAERQNAEQQTYARRANAAAQGASLLGAANSGLANAQNNLAGTYGNMAQNEGAGAGQMFSNAMYYGRQAYDNNEFGIKTGLNNLAGQLGGHLGLSASATPVALPALQPATAPVAPAPAIAPTAAPAAQSLNTITPEARIVPGPQYTPIPNPWSTITGPAPAHNPIEYHWRIAQ